MKKTLFALCTASMLLTALPVYSAFFPAKNANSVYAEAKDVSTLATTTLPAEEAVAVNALAPAQQKQRQGFWKRLKTRLLRYLLPDGENDKQILAFILGLTLGLLGMHRLYLGYGEQGLIYLLFTLSAVGILFAGASISLIAMAGTAGFMVFLRLALYVMIPVVIWLIVDLVRIAAGTLRPK